MNIADMIRVRGDVTITLRDKDGNIIEQIKRENLVVSNGKTILAKLLGHDAGYLDDYVSNIKFGTDATAANVADTGLKCAGGNQFTAAATASYPAYNKVRFSATMAFNEGGSLTYQEMGLFTANIAPKMFSRIVINPIVKSTAVSIEVEWDISFQ